MVNRRAVGKLPMVGTGRLGNRPPIGFVSSFLGDFARFCSWYKQTGRDMVHCVNEMKCILTFIENIGI